MATMVAMPMEPQDAITGEANSDGIGYRASTDLGDKAPQPSAATACDRPAVPRRCQRERRSGAQWSMVSMWATDGAGDRSGLDVF
eukprot:Skav233177  [mRNA]  locus=scaffold24:114258:115016:+ [translate_table: standard]